MHHERTVFAGDPNPNDPAVFEQLMSAMAAINALGYGFELISDEESTALDLHQITWQLPDDAQTEVCFVRDCHNQMGYITAKSQKQSLVRDVINAFEAALPAITQPEIVARCGRDLPIEPTLLLKLALIARKNDPEVIGILREAIDHRLPAVRYYAARAMAITKWHTFEEDLEAALKMETDHDVRSMAENALQICAKEASFSRKSR